MMPTSVTSKGFTIIELLLALAISGFLLTAVYSTLRTTQMVSDNTSARFDRTQQWRYFQGLVRDDLKNAVSQLNGFSASPDTLTFHRYAITPGEGLVELSYAYQDTAIIRNAQHDANQSSQQVMVDVEAFHCRYQHEGSWQSTFNAQGAEIPGSVECTVTRDGFERQLMVNLEIQVPSYE